MIFFDRLPWTLFTNPTETTLTPTLATGDKTHNAILQLANHLNRNVFPPSQYEPLHTRTAAASAYLQKSNVSVTQSRNFSNFREHPTKDPVTINENTSKPSHHHLRGNISPSISLPVTITCAQLVRVLDKSRPFPHPSESSQYLHSLLSASCCTFAPCPAHFRTHHEPYL